jgi:hypothetical protein
MGYTHFKPVIRSNMGWCKSQGCGLIQPLDSVFVRGCMKPGGVMLFPLRSPTGRGSSDDVAGSSGAYRTLQAPLSRARHAHPPKPRQRRRSFSAQNAHVCR